jgi:hypothetical protein
VGKPNERERERSYYSASGKYITTTITEFPAKRKIPHSTKTVPKSASISVPKKSVQLYIFSLSNTSKFVPKYLLYVQQQNCPLLQQKTLKWLPQNLCNKLPRFLCPPSMLYGLYGSVQYDLSNNRKFSTHKTENPPWDLCPRSLGKCALFVVLFPLSSLLRNPLSISSSCVLHTTQCILL